MFNSKSGCPLEVSYISFKFWSTKLIEPWLPAIEVSLAGRPDPLAEASELLGFSWFPAGFSIITAWFALREVICSFSSSEFSCSYVILIFIILYYI